MHSDICELNGILTRGGKQYFITFIDDCSRYTHVYLITHEDEAFNMFKIYKAEVENQKGKRRRIFVRIMVLSIRKLHLAPHNKMVWQKGRT